MDVDTDLVERVLARARARRTQAADPGWARVVRLRCGLSQGDVASLVGVGRSAISRWESGRRGLRAGDALVRYRALIERLAREERVQ